MLHKTNQTRRPNNKPKANMKRQIGILTLVPVGWLTGCGSNEQYWQQRTAAVNALPPNQRAAAMIELMQEHRAEQLLQEQRNAAALVYMGQGLQNAGAIYAARSYTDPYTFQNLQAARPSTLGTPLNPVQVQLRP
ncbi:MAG: hypothetical protein DME98_11775 [Verrucomicrobia bacterium]|nr:MAG: hypothetical protein DME98_11775 [Verrucomicrobiota bacterium]PYJ35000.1 MAG: hypothetical protein DME88_03150 [Verrucomicrobiota bacterium]